MRRSRTRCRYRRRCCWWRTARGIGGRWMFGRGLRGATKTRSQECERCTHECVRHVGAKDGSTTVKRTIHFKGTRLALAGCTLLLSNLAWADTAPMIADAYFNPGDANTYGSLPAINIGGAPNSQGLMWFDLTRLPAGIT